MKEGTSRILAMASTLKRYKIALQHAQTILAVSVSHGFWVVQKELAISKIILERKFQTIPFMVEF